MNNRIIFFSIFSILLTVLLTATVTTYYLNLKFENNFSTNGIYLHRYQTSDFYKSHPKLIGSNPFDIDTTYKRILSNFPYEENQHGTIDKNIVQMWIGKDKNMDNIPWKELRARWVDLNPDHNYTLFTGSEVRDAVRKTFKDTVPEVWEAFSTLPMTILESDFSRYVILFLQGGIWADLDTVCERPVEDWFHLNVNSDIGFVAGVEQDYNSNGYLGFTSRRIQFLQWSFMARKYHPILALAIANIVKVTFKAKADGKFQVYYNTFRDVDKCKSIDIMDWTGPGIFSDTVYQYMSNLQNPDILDFDFERSNGREELIGPSINEKINWKFFTGLRHPVIVNNDVCILPRSGLRCMDYDPSLEEYCYVSHKFSGSWKSGN
ncbi:hypothetical protein B5S28_g4879 [[Candida] boidinii]|uniref:Unnamed protein product n=1 Tax=Candida boidinii TaxID=5477 RepID=A0ACB5TM50_CANBO|nr:hypothetical protein B5S28_g4879 [[Candida] boidinii]OWB62379.1 hypothetical protein B5S29_g3305 [[Candida] boidinii]OWB75130.1 hypothetical protein B5S31_g4988 [[Candida] boidinii]OWB79449.1 hypothetical protein B5S32_g3671 [[Candida] boidinii]GME91053.1 unnamed protein product [[Candida] boidinii]